MGNDLFAVFTFLWAWKLPSLKSKHPKWPRKGRRKKTRATAKSRARWNRNVRQNGSLLSGEQSSEPSTSGSHISTELQSRNAHDA